jgi:hypothetical protein
MFEQTNLENIIFYSRMTIFFLKHDYFGMKIARKTKPFDHIVMQSGYAC